MMASGPSSLLIRAIISEVLFPVNVLTCILDFHHGYGFESDVRRYFRLRDDRHGRQKTGQELGIAHKIIQAINKAAEKGIVAEGQPVLLTSPLIRLRREADFYGAMDGAGKFVSGDVNAGMFITFINIVGGIFIGVLQKDMSWMSLVEATFSASRRSVVTSRTDGKIENSRGEVMNIEVMRMTSEKEMETRELPPRAKSSKPLDNLWSGAILPSAQLFF